MHFDFAAIRLYEVALLENPQATGNPTHNDPSRLETLYSLLLATKSLLTTILNLPTTANISLSYITWAQFSYALMILERLSFFKSASCPSWNIPFVRSIIDFSAVLDKFGSLSEQAHSHNMSLFNLTPVQTPEQEELRKRNKMRVQFARAWFEKRVQLGDDMEWDMAMEKARLMQALDNEVRGPETGQLPTPTSTTDVNIPLETPYQDMLLDTTVFDGFNDESFWFDLAGEWSDGAGFYDPNLVGF